MRNEAISFLLAALLVVLFALTLIMIIGCRQTEPMDPPRPFIGDWAGEFVVDGETFLLNLSIRKDGTYQAATVHGADTLTRERGKWDATEIIFRTYGQVCEEGEPLHLVACSEDWESVPIDIEAGAWSLHFTDGGRLHSVTLRRVG